MATSKLQRLFGDMLDKRLPEYRIRENYRPDWLISSENTWLELDFYIEELKVAFEVQGAQHYEFTPFFHKSVDDFKKRRRHDNEKRNLCYGKGIKLIEICTITDAEIAIKNIEEKTKRDRPKYFYQDPGLTPRKRKPREIIDKFSGLKSQLRRKNEPGEVAKRLERARANIEKYEAGILEAEEEKYYHWKMIVERNGLIDIEYEYKRVIEKNLKQNEAIK